MDMGLVLEVVGNMWSRTETEACVSTCIWNLAKALENEQLYGIKKNDKNLCCVQETEKIKAF